MFFPLIKTGRGKNGCVKATGKRWKKGGKEVHMFEKERNWRKRNSIQNNATEEERGRWHTLALVKLPLGSTLSVYDAFQTYPRELRTAPMLGDKLP